MLLLKLVLLFKVLSPTDPSAVCVKNINCKNLIVLKLIMQKIAEVVMLAYLTTVTDTEITTKQYTELTKSGHMSMNKY